MSFTRAMRVLFSDRLSSRIRRCRTQNGLESLEPRCLLTTSLTPVVVASIHDEPRDGNPDSFNTSFPELTRQQSYREDRAIAEFDLGIQTSPVTLGVLDFQVYGNIYGDPVRTFTLTGYSGNGVADLSDYSIAGTSLRTISHFAAQGGDNYRLDVTDFVESLRQSGATHLGIRLDSVTDVGPVYLHQPTLNLNGLTAQTWQRSFESVPNVIRADGAEGFHLEVDTGADVQSVVLAVSGTAQYYLTEPGNQAVITLRDDGTNGDRVAGDFVYTTGEFRFDVSSPFPAAFWGLNTDSPTGVWTVPVGVVTVSELDGIQNTFRLDPEVGLLSTDVPLVTTSQMSSTVRASNYLINVNTTAQATQATIRGNRNNMDQLTPAVIQAMGDNFDFFMMFSTQRMENLPRNDFENIIAGQNHHAQWDFTGTAFPLSDNTAYFGSNGRLKSVNLLDFLGRGMNSRTATHELVHHWSAFFDETLGINDDAHYRGNSSAGSIVGGQAWMPNGDGSYTIDWNEGGSSGATHVAPIDLYMMGLIPASEVPPIMVYDPTLAPNPTLTSIVQPNQISRTTTVDEIIGRHGVRTPQPSAGIQKDFQLGFVAETHNRWLTPSELTFYETFAAHYTRPIPADEADPHVGGAWSSINRFFGHGTTWTSLLPGRSAAVNNAPVITSEVFEVPENSTYNTTVGTLIASDPDAGQTLTYAIKSMDSTTHHFLIDSRTGRISVAYALDRETRPEYSVTVVVSDSGLPSQYDTKVITIRVTDRNDTVPVIPADQSFSVAENSLNGILVGTIAVTDPDTTGVLQNFTIVSGNSDGVFAIDPSTGTVTVANSSLLNFEVGPVTRTLNVTVSDGITTSTSQSVTVTVTDVNEAPAFPAATFNLAENSANGTIAGTVAASDPDAGQSMTYSIVSGNTNSAFAVNSSTGQIAVINTAAIDFEITPQFLLQVRAADNGNPQLETVANITIRLTDVTEFQTVTLDVNPGSVSNTIRQSGKYEVAILSTSAFDARTINVGSIRFGKLGTEDSIAKDKKGNRVYSYRDVNGDGRLDLVLQINGAATGLKVGDTLAKLTGLLNSGLDIFGSAGVVVKR